MFGYDPRVLLATVAAGVALALFWLYRSMCTTRAEVASLRDAFARNNFASPASMAPVGRLPLREDLHMHEDLREDLEERSPGQEYYEDEDDGARGGEYEAEERVQG